MPVWTLTGRAFPIFLGLANRCPMLRSADLLVFTGFHSLRMPCPLMYHGCHKVVQISTRYPKLERHTQASGRSAYALKMWPISRTGLRMTARQSFTNITQTQNNMFCKAKEPFIYFFRNFVVVQEMWKYSRNKIVASLRNPTANTF